MDSFGMPAMASPAEPYCPLRPGVKVLRHRQRQWTQALAAAACKGPSLQPIARRLRDLGGEENGLWLRANAGPDLQPLDDLEWVINMRLRLDLQQGETCLCQHRRAAIGGIEGKRCLEPLDPFGIHALQCMIGGARTTLHNSLCRIVHTACVSAGLRAQREVVVPALATAKLTEPRVDVDAWGHPGLPHLRLDVTVTDPLAERHKAAAAQQHGAADHAEDGKAKKYGKPRGGVGVKGLGLELTGRLGECFAALLRQLAGLARAGRAALGQESTRFLAHWQCQISIALARFSAAAISAAYIAPVWSIHCTAATV